MAMIAGGGLEIRRGFMSGFRLLRQALVTLTQDVSMHCPNMATSTLFGDLV
jgi:hypothetical protein